MIPGKLYIPTTTLNFNSIMSSESISPAKFYSERKFGYSRFYKVAPNNFDYSITLYEKCPQFDITDKELENYPIVIQIDTKSIRDGLITKIAENTFISNQTIYINPISSRVIFRKQQELITTLAKAEPSIEAKLVYLYSNCFCLIDNTVDCFKWKGKEKDVIYDDSKKDISTFIYHDRRANKLKGFLYTYLIGYNKKTSPLIISLKGISKKIINIFSAIIASPNAYPTTLQKEKLYSLFKEFEDTINEAEGINIKINEVLRQEALKYDLDEYNLVRYLKDKNLYGIRTAQICNENNLKISYDINELYQILNSSINKRQEAFECYMAGLETAIKRLELKFQGENLRLENLPVINNNVIDKMPQNSFLAKLFNECLNELWDKEEFLHARYEFAKAGGKIFRDELIIENKWKDSSAQQYINNLLINLNEHKPFDINSPEIKNNQTLKSFAAFCQKGDDIDKFEDHLIANGISDYEIAFGLWGAVFGFADMPKTFTNDLFLSADSNYICEAYKCIFKQVHGVDLKGKLEKNEVEYQRIPAKINVVEIQPLVINNFSIEEELFRFDEFKSLTPKIRQEVVVKLIELGITNLVNWDDKKAGEIKWDSQKGQKKLIAAISKSKKKPVKSTTKRTDEIKIENNLFANAIPEEYFYLDKFIFDRIENRLPKETKIHRQVKEDLDWFQDNYQEYYNDKKNGKQKGRYFGKPIDNRSVIEKFQDYLKNKKNGNQKWLRETYSLVDIEQIIAHLKELYLLNER